MIQFVEYKNIDKHKWDDCISKCTHPSIFVYSWYLDIVSESNWCALISNDYEAVFPFVTKSKYGYKYVFQPFFTRYFGVYSVKPFKESLVSEFLDSIPPKFRYIEFCLNESNSLIKRKSEELNEKSYQFLNLNNSYDNIRKAYSENARRAIKKSLKNNFEIRANIEPDKIVSLFKSTKGDDLNIFKDNDYKILINLMNYCLLNKIGISYAVYEENLLVAAAFFMFNNQTYIYLKSGLTESGKTKGAMYLLIDHFIQKNSEKNQYLDFGGSSVENVAQFYKKFGAKDCVYLQVKKNELPLLARLVKK